MNLTSGSGDVLNISYLGSGHPFVRRRGTICAILVKRNNSVKLF